MYVVQLWKEKTRTLGCGISNMSYESIFDKVNDISIHSNGYSNLYYQGERLDSTEVVYVLNVADIAYAMKHYKNGTIVVCNEKIYTIKDGCAVFY